MDKAAEKHCKSCHSCQLVAQPDPPEPIKSTSLPDAPWQHLAADLLGPFPSGHSILVVVDYYSRFYEYHILRSTTTDKVIDAMEEMFSRHGLPLTIKTDNGPQFKAAEFDAYCTANGRTREKVIGKFDCYGDQANIGTCWTRWLNSFELFVERLFVERLVLTLFYLLN